jgi:hypothetical protein
MDDGVAQLARVIAADAGDEMDARVFGTSDAGAIAREVDRFCREELGGAVARALFHEASQASVTGVELVDGRRVVVKGHRPEEELAWLQEVVRVQMHLASRGLPATTVCGGPAPLGRGLAVVEAFVERGRTRDGRDPVVRAALARGLWAIVEACRPLVAGSTLRPHYFTELAAGDVRGDEPPVDELALAARARLQPAGEIVVGHGDWRVQHARFDGDRIVAAFDWAGLCKEREPALVGFTAFAFCVDWSKEPVPATPLEDARAFVADYEAARGRAFTADERRLCGALFAYAYAYMARNVEGTFRAVVASHGAHMLEL